MALAADTILPIEEGIYNEIPVAATTKIYEGAVVSLSSGYAKGYAGTDTIFLGIAARQADNSAGGAGAITVKVQKNHHYRQVTLTGVAITNVGAAVYASDDGTFTLTASTNLPVGKVSRFVATNTCVVKFEPVA